MATHVAHREPKFAPAAPVVLGPCCSPEWDRLCAFFIPLSRCAPPPNGGYKDSPIREWLRPVRARTFNQASATDSSGRGFR